MGNNNRIFYGSQIAQLKPGTTGNKYGYWNSLLIHKDLHCLSIEDGKKIIKKILSDQNIYKHYLLIQNNLLSEISHSDYSKGRGQSVGKYIF